MIEDKATEKLKKRAQDLGLIVNAGETQGTIASQTKTTRHLDEHFKQDADEEMADEREGGKK
ncbi:MAG: hypothetical protein M3R15_17990 [Acidobacteriota bacterium]|nr:hypothetical protein [Acidobacteriota bacterium]